MLSDPAEDAVEDQPKDMQEIKEQISQMHLTKASSDRMRGGFMCGYLTDNIDGTEDMDQMSVDDLDGIDDNMNDTIDINAEIEDDLADVAIEELLHQEDNPSHITSSGARHDEDTEDSKSVSGKDKEKSPPTEATLTAPSQDADSQDPTRSRAILGQPFERSISRRTSGQLVVPAVPGGAGAVRPAGINLIPPRADAEPRREEPDAAPAVQPRPADRAMRQAAVIDSTINTLLYCSLTAILAMVVKIVLANTFEYPASK